MANDRREPSRTDRAVGGLRALFHSARDRARDQGIVEGSTMFFKNLAESVAFSHRNLKIGLAVVTVALVVVSGSLGVLVARSFTTQEQTRATLERQMKGAGEDLARQLQALQTSLQALEDRQKTLELALAQAEEARRNGQEQARATLAQLQASHTREVEELKKTTEQVKAWIESFNRTYLTDRRVLVQRIDALSPPKR